MDNSSTGFSPLGELPYSYVTPTPANSTIMDEIKSDSKLSKQFQEFLNFCPSSSKEGGNVNLEQVEKFVAEGAELANKIRDDKIVGADKTPKNIVCVMWYMTALCAKQGKLFTNGSIRIDDPNQKLQKFLEAVAGDKVYERISTHMNENVTNTDKQKGIDLPGMNLPIKARTILFAKQPDGTLFIKMEKRGVPPFWKKGFATLENFKEFVLHSIDFIHSRFRKKSISSFATRKEHVPKDIKE